MDHVNGESGSHHYDVGIPDDVSPNNQPQIKPNLPFELAAGLVRRLYDFPGCRLLKGKTELYVYSFSRK